MLVLLVLAIGINYVDRGSLAIVKTNIASEFKVDDVKMGLLFSAFFWSYALSQLVTGWFVDRFDVKWIYAGGFVIWSVATILMGFSTGFTMFFLLRLVLGFGESVAYPATSRMIVENFDEHRRGFANSLIDAASKLGPAISIFLGGWLVARSDWQTLFLVVGIGGLFWLPAWIYLVPSAKSSGKIEQRITNHVGFRHLLRRREVWGTSMGFFCLGYTWAFLISWLPAYLEESRGFSKETMATLGSLPFLFTAMTAIFGGWLADKLIHRGHTPTLVRKSFLIIGLLLCAIFLPLSVIMTNDYACITLMCIACASLGFYTANVWAMTQTLAGSSAAGQWTGLQNAIGNMGAAVSPALTGWLISKSGTYSSSFFLAAFVLFIGVLPYAFMVRKVAPLKWHSEEFEPAALPCAGD